MKVEWADRISELALRTPDGMLRAINNIVTRLTPGLRNGLTVRDNMNAAVITLGTAKSPLTGGVEFPIVNPLTIKQPGFQPWYAVDTAGNPLAIGPAKVNPFRSDGRLGITVSFDAVGPYAELQPTADQTIGNVAIIPVTWTTQNQDPTGIISLTSDTSGPATTRISVSQAGLYQFSYHITFAASATGLRLVWTSKNLNGSFSNGNERRGFANLFTNTDAGGQTTICCVAEWPLAAADYVEVFVYQDSGGSVTLPGTVDTRSRLRVRRVAFLPGFAGTSYSISGIVIGVLWGG